MSLIGHGDDLPSRGSRILLIFVHMFNFLYPALPLEKSPATRSGIGRGKLRGVVMNIVCDILR